MDQITHLTQKMLAERARQQQSPPETAPPPYSAADDDSDADSDDEDDEPWMPVKLTINAAHSIQGSNNLVPTSPTPLADATKFSTLLLHAVNQINAANCTANANTERAFAKPRRSLKVDLTINCGITVIGDRNVIGNVGLKPKSPNGVPPGITTTVNNTATVAGAKRKADDATEVEGEPAPKKVAAE